jgi:hypothetical protein
LEAASEREAAASDKLDSGSDNDSSVHGEDVKESESPRRHAAPHFESSVTQKAELSPAEEFEASGSEGPAEPPPSDEARVGLGTPEKAESADAQSSEFGEVIQCEPVQIVSAIGGRATIAIPFKKQLWSRRQIRASFRPERAGLWLSADKGTIEPGAREFPFTLHFGPTEAVSFETTLVVSFGDFEMRVPIAASTQEARRRRHHHSE